MLTRMFAELTDVNQERLARVIHDLAEAIVCPEAGDQVLVDEWRNRRFSGWMFMPLQSPPPKERRTVSIGEDVLGSEQVPEPMLIPKDYRQQVIRRGPVDVKL